MKMIGPVAITDAMLAASNVTETTTYNAGTTYALGDEIEIASNHKRYVSAQNGNTGNTPQTDDGTWWIEMGATNRWRAFDQKLGQSVSKSGSLYYELDIPSRVTGIALLGVGGVSARVRLQDMASGTVTVYDETREAVDTIGIVDWYSYFTWVPEFETELLFTDLPGFAVNRVRVDIDGGGGNATVAQIVVGRMDVLGVTLDDSGIGIEDYSTKERDAFGNAIIVQRDYIETVEFSFMIDTGTERTVRRRLAAQRATPTVYFADEALLNTGGLIYGIFQDFNIPLRSDSKTICSLEIEGLT